MFKFYDDIIVPVLPTFKRLTVSVLALLNPIIFLSSCRYNMTTPIMKPKLGDLLEATRSLSHGMISVYKG